MKDSARTVVACQLPSSSIDGWWRKEGVALFGTFFDFSLEPSLISNDTECEKQSKRKLERPEPLEIKEFSGSLLELSFASNTGACVEPHRHAGRGS